MPYYKVPCGTGFVIFNFETFGVAWPAIVDSKTADDLLATFKLAWCQSQGRDNNGDWKK